MNRLLKKLGKLVKEREELTMQIKELTKMMAEMCPIGVEYEGVMNRGYISQDVAWKGAFLALASKVPDRLRDQYVDEAIQKNTKKSVKNKFELV